MFVYERHFRLPARPADGGLTRGGSSNQMIESLTRPSLMTVELEFEEAVAGDAAFNHKFVIYFSMCAADHWATPTTPTTPSCFIQSSARRRN